MSDPMIDLRTGAGGAARGEHASSAAADAAADIHDAFAGDTHDAEAAASSVRTHRYPSDLERELHALIGGADMAALGPDMIFAMLRSRLRDQDGQIATIMNGLNERTHAAEAISQELSHLRGVQGVLTHQPYMDREGNISMTQPIQRGQFDQLCEAAGLSPAEADAIWAANVNASAVPPTVVLGEALNQILPSAPGAQSAASQFQVSSGFDNALDDLNQRLQDVNRGNELLMIKLQTTMDQRKQTIMMSTNMLQTFDESLSRILENL